MPNADKIDLILKASIITRNTEISQGKKEAETDGEKKDLCTTTYAPSSVIEVKMETDSRKACNAIATCIKANSEATKKDKAKGISLYGNDVLYFTLLITSTILDCKNSFLTHFWLGLFDRFYPFVISFLRFTHLVR